MYLDLVVKDSKRPWVIPNVIAAAVLGVDDIMGSRRVASRGPPQADGAATAVFFLYAAQDVLMWWQRSYHGSLIGMRRKTLLKLLIKP